MKVENESEVAQLCLTLSDRMDFSPPGSSVHGIFQARVLEWGALPSPIFYLEVCKYLLTANCLHLIFPFLNTLLLITTNLISCSMSLLVCLFLKCK